MGWILKAGAENIIGGDQATCCDQLKCGNFDGCGAGWVLKNDAADLVGSDQTTCCDQVKCGTFTGCGDDWILKAGAENIIGNDQATCCEEHKEEKPSNITTTINPCATTKSEQLPLPNPCDDNGSN